MKNNPIMALIRQIIPLLGKRIKNRYYEHTDKLHGRRIGSVGVQVKAIIIKIHIIQQHLKITMVGQKIIRMGDIRLIILPDM